MPGGNRDREKTCPSRSQCNGLEIYTTVMCRNIKMLFNFEPPASPDEIRAAALQYVRKVSGMTRPAKANQPAFGAAVDQIATVTAALLDELVTTAPARDRAVEAEKARQRWQKRAQR